MTASTATREAKQPVVEFFFDLACPRSYLASRRIEEVAARCGARAVYRPVRPRLVESDDDARRSAPRRTVDERDLVRSASRSGVDPRRVVFVARSTLSDATLPTMRALAATASDDARRAATRRAFRAVWEDGASIASENDDDDDDDDEGKELRFATERAVREAGVFVAPSFVARTSSSSSSSLLFCGYDRLFLLERALGRMDAAPSRLVPKPIDERKRKLTFYFDLASPWSCVAWSRVTKMMRDPTYAGRVELEPVPILLGALFRAIGTPMAPILRASKNQRRYALRELALWADFLGGGDYDLRWPDAFPIRTVTPLRLVSREPSLTGLLFRAAWRDNQNIGDDAVLRRILPPQYQRWVDEPVPESVKERLRANTERAQRAGCPGVPCFQVDDGDVVFGQDRLNVVEDLLCGWRDESSQYVVSSTAASVGGRSSPKRSKL